MKNLYFFRKSTAIVIILLTTINAVFAQNAIIKGKITTADGKAAEFVNVQLNGTTKGTISDVNGAYRLERVKAGSFTIKVSLIGLETKEQRIEVKAGKTLVVDFTLAETANQLQEVVVSANNKFAQKETDFVARMPLKNLENPQAYNVVSKELLKEQLVTSFDDAIKNAPGVNRLWTATGRGGDGAGYFSMRGFSVQPTMINGVAGQTNGGIDPANIERIEKYQKGPIRNTFWE